MLLSLSLSLSLVLIIKQLTEGNTTFTIHRLMQSVFRKKQTDKQADRRDNITQLLKCNSLETHTI